MTRDATLSPPATRVQTSAFRTSNSTSDVFNSQIFE